MRKIFWNSLSEIDKKVLLTRAANHVGNEEFVRLLKDIINNVKVQGDNAILNYTQMYDKAKLQCIKVTENELHVASQSLSPAIRESIEFAIKNIESYHLPQIPKALSVTTQTGVICERQVRAIQRVGLYVPGGNAPLVSTVMMLAIPAKLANCPLRILATPPDQDGHINPILLATAVMCGVQDIYKMGGAQAISAMAYGTETVPKVDKIFGPGNTWVTQAKLLVSQDPEGAAMDLPAGPSELMVIADQNANAAYIAADLLSQAEHGVDSQVFLVTASEQLADKVSQALQVQIQVLARKKTIEKSLEKGAIVIVNSLEEAVFLSNLYAPEHLILHTDNAESIVPNIYSASAVFVGPWSPETVGDYVTGSNHVLPTYGYAKSYSGLSVLDFIKFINVQSVSKMGLKALGKHAAVLSEIEGLMAHKKAVSIRLQDLGEQI
jgi:histidinol dehydrogenase